MRISIITAALLAASASAFSPTPFTVKNGVKLSASTIGGFPDDYIKKPLHRKESTTPKQVKPVNWLQRQAVPDTVIPPDYFLSWSLALLGALIMWYHPSYAADGSPSLIGIFGGGFHILFAGLLYVQTARVRCVFEKDAFEFYNLKGRGEDAELVRKPDNYVSGTRNRWKYDAITNWGFFPSLEYPVICYFKETQTPKEQWGKWFAAFDSYGRGQPHFFPGICNARKFKEQLELRGVKRKPIRPDIE